MPSTLADDTITAFIEGQHRRSAEEASIDAISPATGERIARYAPGDAGDVEAAVCSARKAFDDGRWSDLPPSVRKRVLNDLADRLQERASKLDALDAEDMGKPIGTPFGSSAVAANLTRFYAEAVDKLTGDVFSSDKKSFVTQRRVPRGVVGAIVPWNFPAYVAALKFAPALAAGNAVVLKPSENSLRSALLIAQCAIDAGLPPGVLNVLPGLGTTVGKGLALHGDVDMLSFTGSTAVGKLMMQYAGQSNLKPLVAECGGKSPQILFDDGIDIDTAAEVIARGILTNQGQICSAGSRVLVERSIEPRLVERIAAIMESVRIGDPRDPATEFGPVASAVQCSRILDYIAIAQHDGALLALGGARIAGREEGCYVAPTLLRDVPAQSRAAREEIFGPVLAILPFSTEAEAIALANDTIYGLTAYAWTSDIARAMRLANGIRSSIRINAAAPSGEGAGPAYSYEPAGQSGFGAESGLAGMESYTRRQLVWINH